MQGDPTRPIFHLLVLGLHWVCGDWRWVRESLGPRDEDPTRFCYALQWNIGFKVYFNIDGGSRGGYRFLEKGGFDVFQTLSPTRLVLFGREHFRNYLLICNISIKP